MNRRLMSCLVLLVVQLGFARLSAAQDVQPGEPIHYRAMYPERWKAKGTSLNLYPWEGKHVILLTTKKDLDPAIMGIFVKRLDAGWELYTELVKTPPVTY